MFFQIEVIIDNTTDVVQIREYLQHGDTDTERAKGGSKIEKGTA